MFSSKAAVHKELVFRGTHDDVGYGKARGSPSESWSLILEHGMACLIRMSMLSHQVCSRWGATRPLEPIRLALVSFLQLADVYNTRSKTSD